MKFEVKNLIDEAEFLEQAIVDKYRAQGATFTEKVASLQGKAPEKVVDDLTLVAQLYERAKKGETPTENELTRIASTIDALYPLVATRNRAANWIVWVVLLAGVIYACWRFLPR